MKIRNGKLNAIKNFYKSNLKVSINIIDGPTFSVFFSKSYILKQYKKTIIAKAN